MKTNYFKNSICSLVITSMILVPYFGLAPKAEAQNYSNNINGQYSVQSTGGGSAGIEGYLKGLAPVILKLPKCQALLGKGMASVFGGIKSILSKKTTTVTRDKPFGPMPDGTNLDQAGGEAASQASAVPVFLPATTEKKIDKILENTLGTANSTGSTDDSKTCLDAIGRMVTKLMLQKLTIATIDMINGGRFGESFYLKDEKNTFLAIAGREVLQFGTEIHDPTIYPFGREFIKAQIGAFKNQFRDNARYSLNDLISQTNPKCKDSTGHPVGCDTAFYADFSAGGWNAWNFMMQVPSNNPLGFQLLASGELSKRLAGTNQSTAQNTRDDLIQSGGFLGKERCAKPSHDITRQEDDQALSKGIPLIKDEVPGQYYPPFPRRCERWEYVTPGKMIAEAGAKLVKYPDNQYLKAEDMNDAIAAIADAAIEHFGTPLLDDFAGTDKTGGDGSFLFDIENFGNSLSGDSQTQTDFPDYLQNTWLAEHPDFDIRKDLTQGIIDEQRTYVLKLEDLDRTLDDLNRTIYQLDYCIPGPHPGWEEDSRVALQAEEDKIVAKTVDDDLSNTVATIGASAGAALALIPGVGWGVAAGVALVGGIVSTILGNNADDELAAYYGAYVQALTAIHIGSDAAISQKQEVTNALDTIFARYIDKIHQYFTPDFLPAVAPQAVSEYKKTVGYTQMIKNNKETLSVLSSVVTRLPDIKERIDQLNSDLNNGIITEVLPNGDTVIAANQPEAYEKKLKPIIEDFGRISASMASGDDIASIDNVVKQAKEEVRYVYEDLLTGPNGCENDLERHAPLAPNGNQDYALTGEMRPAYPLPIWYDYNDFHGQETLPVPGLGGATTHGIQPYISNTAFTGNIMSGRYAKNDDPQIISSGFLGGINFDDSSNSCDEILGQHHAWILDCIPVTDLFLHADNQGGGVHVGTRVQHDQYDQWNSFEKTIAIF